METSRLPKPSPLAQRIAHAFHADQHEIYLVGGAVRAALLGREDTDLDFATSARPEVSARILESLGTGSLYRLGEKFGTVALHIDDTKVEITTYRSSEVYPSHSRKPEVQFGVTLLEDLSRRDLTINAIARDPILEQLIDPFGGLQDFASGVIRAVGSPPDRFREDPLRLLRAIRFASELGFSVERVTWEGLRETAPDLRSISRERIRDEYSRMLAGPDPVRALELLRDSGLMAVSVPELLQLTAMPDHGPRHPLSLWDHTMRVVARVSPRLHLRWAALLHDIAKPATRTHEPDGRPRFFHHEEVGASIARHVLSGLRYPNQLRSDVSLLIDTHMQLHAYSPDWSDGAVRRLRLRLGPLLGDAIELARADGAGHSLSGQSLNSPKLNELVERIHVLDREVTVLESPLTGNQLMARYNKPPGPWIGRIKNALRNEVVEGRLAPEDQDSAWRIADELAAASS